MAAGTPGTSALLSGETLGRSLRAGGAQGGGCDPELSALVPGTTFLFCSNKPPDSAFHLLPSPKPLPSEPRLPAPGSWSLGVPSLVSYLPPHPCCFLPLGLNSLSGYPAPLLAHPPSSRQRSSLTAPPHCLAITCLWDSLGSESLTCPWAPGLGPLRSLATPEPRKEMAGNTFCFLGSVPGAPGQARSPQGGGKGDQGANKSPGKNPCLWDFLPVLRPLGAWLALPWNSSEALFCLTDLKGLEPLSVKVPCWLYPLPRPQPRPCRTTQLIPLCSLVGSLLPAQPLQKPAPLPTSPLPR